MLIAMGATLACMAIGAQSQPADPGQEAGAAASTYRGWQLYQTRCALCHGPDATGGGNAPNLLLSIASMDISTFSAAVLSRHPKGLRAGAIAPEGSAERKAWLDDMQRRAEGKRSMPDWSGDEEVRGGIASLHRFLRARADGSLDTRPPRRPEEVAPRR